MDLGQAEAAVAMLQVRELAAGTTELWAARLRYAYADALLAAGRREEAREWFARAAELDEDLGTDAAERLLELDGIVLDDDEDDEELDDEEFDDEELDGEDLDSEALDGETGAAQETDAADADVTARADGEAIEDDEPLDDDDEEDDDIDDRTLADDVDDDEDDEDDEDDDELDDQPAAPAAGTATPHIITEPTGKAGPLFSDGQA
jgi:hypothetical protein